MPRARKTSSGAKAQPIQAVRGQEYGSGVKQEQMQRAMPAPADPGMPKPTPVNVQPQPMPQEGAQPQPQTAEAPPAPDFAALRQALSGVGGVLRRPDERPDLPYTSTLQDPGARFRLGITSPVNRTGEMMRELSRRTGDSVFADLAARAGL